VLLFREKYKKNKKALDNYEQKFYNNNI
jgi:hypothetical protein